jgi:hypothetical protein
VRFKLLVLMSLVLLFAAAVNQVTLSAPTQQAAPGLSLVPVTEAVVPGGLLDIEVRVEGVTNLAAFELELDWEPEQVTFTHFTLASFLGNDEATCDAGRGRCAIPLGPLAREPGIERIGAFSYGNGSAASGSGLLATLHFEINEAAAGTTVIAPLGAFLADTQVNRIVPDASGAMIQIGPVTPSPTATEQPIVTPTASNTPRATQTATAPASATPSTIPSATSEASATPTGTSVASATATPTATPTSMPTQTASPSATTTLPTATVNPSPTATVGHTQHRRYLPVVLQNTRRR